VIEVSPIWLKQKVERLNVPDAFICRDNENVIEYERIGNRVRIADGYQAQA